MNYLEVAGKDELKIPKE